MGGSIRPHICKFPSKACSRAVITEPKPSETSKPLIAERRTVQQNPVRSVLAQNPNRPTERETPIKKTRSLAVPKSVTDRHSTHETRSQTSRVDSDVFGKPHAKLRNDKSVQPQSAGRTTHHDLFRAPTHVRLMVRPSLEREVPHKSCNSLLCN